jgi:hypothetical protein
MSKVNTLLVIGAGQMGGGIAQIAAVAGLNVYTFDVMEAQLERSEMLHSKLLNRAVEKGKLEQADADAALERITYLKNLDDAQRVDWVVEAATENPELKAKIFADLEDRFVDPGVVLATNTSSISITEIAAATTTPSRVIGMHFFYPVPVMKLVEVINGLETDEMVTEAHHRPRRGDGQDRPPRQRPGGVRLQPRPHAHDQRGLLRLDGRRRGARGARRHHEARLQLPHGPPPPRRLHRARHLRPHHGRARRGLNNDRYRPCPMLRNW